MRPIALAVAALMLISSLSCRKQRSNDVSGVGDTAGTADTAVAPAPEVPAAAPRLEDYTFDQRQDFAQSIRQQLADIDQQISDLRAQAKSRGGAVSDRALAGILASRRAVERDLKRVNTATAGNWDQIKNAVTRGIDQLNDAIEGAQPK